MFIVSARISPDDSRKVEVTFSEEVDISTLDVNDFTFLNNDTVNPVVNTGMGDENKVIFILSENSTKKQRIMLNYTPGIFASVNNIMLEEVRNYILQYGEAKDKEEVDDLNIYFEAESGIVGSNYWDLHIDAFTSNAAYLMTQPGLEHINNASLDTSNLVTYTFKICESGEYTFWARVFAPSPNDDSFWIRMNDGDWTMWNNIGGGSAWVWDKIDQKYSLKTGYNTLTICMREDGKICFSNTDNVPVGTGGYYEECEITTDDFFNNKIESSSVVYPNPASTELIVKSNNKYEYVAIRNILGEVVTMEKMNESDQENVIPIDDLELSIYFLILSNNNNRFYETHKFIKE